MIPRPRDKRYGLLIRPDARRQQLSEQGNPRSHPPDYFARRADGSAVVLDCRPDDRIEPRDAEAFAATERACALVGWDYRRVGAAVPVLVENVRWLAGYRHPRFLNPPMEEALMRGFADRRPLLEGAETAGRPLTVLPVLFHLLWQHELVTDLSVPLHSCAAVTRAAA